MVTQSNAAADTGLASRPSLTLKRRLNARPEKVYAAWADGEKLAQWFGPSQVKSGSVNAELDVRVGGRYRISFEGEGGEYHEVGGVYREVVPNERLVFSWAWHSTPERESLVTISMKPEGGGTLLTYKATASVGGKLAQIGSRLIEGVAKKMSDDFFARFNKTVAPAADPIIQTNSVQPPSNGRAKFVVPVWAWVGGGILVLLIVLYLVR